MALCPIVACLVTVCWILGATSEFKLLFDCGCKGGPLGLQGFMNHWSGGLTWGKEEGWHVDSVFGHLYTEGSLQAWCLCAENHSFSLGHGAFVTKLWQSISQQDQAGLQLASGTGMGVSQHTGILLLLG